MYSSASTKQIFGTYSVLYLIPLGYFVYILEKLAHSSIMRLNKSSMEKLYDLMTMGFKYQIISCTCPEQFLQVTLNHLGSWYVKC